MANAPTAAAPGALCANCVERPATHAGRLDRGGPLYQLCDECELPAREGHGIERGYQPNGGLPTAKEANAGARRVLGDQRYELEAEREKRIGLTPTRSTSDEFDDFLNESFRRHRTGAWSAGGKRR